MLLGVLLFAPPVTTAIGEDEGWRRQVATRAHLSFELPPGWRLTELRAGAVAATSFDPPRGWFAVSGRARRLPRDGAVVFAYPPQGVRFPTAQQRLAQDLVDRFVRAGAVRVFVGPNTGLRGDPRIVQPLGGHDNHLHARIRLRRR